MKRVIIEIIRRHALKTGHWRWLYRRVVARTSPEWGEYLAKWGGFHACGARVAINVGCTITDPYLVRIGDDVTLSACTLLGHNGAITTVRNRFGIKVDSVGAIDIRRNSFIGFGAIVMPGMRIGPDSIVAAGSVVTKDVAPGTIVAGNPAAVIDTLEAFAARLQARTNAYPWADLIAERAGSFDASMESQLRLLRGKYFFDDSAPHVDSALR